MLHATGQRAKQTRAGDGLGQELGGAQREGQLGVVEHRAHDHGNVTRRGAVLQELQHLPAILTRHHDVQDDDIGSLLLGEAQPLGAVLRPDEAVSMVRQVALKQLQHARVVVHHEHRRLAYPTEHHRAAYLARGTLVDPDLRAKVLGEAPGGSRYLGHTSRICHGRKAHLELRRSIHAVRREAHHSAGSGVLHRPAQDAHEHLSRQQGVGIDRLRPHLVRRLDLYLTLLAEWTEGRDSAVDERRDPRLLRTDRQAIQFLQQQRVARGRALRGILPATGGRPPGDHLRDGLFGASQVTVELTLRDRQLLRRLLNRHPFHVVEVQHAVRARAARAKGHVRPRAQLLDHLEHQRPQGTHAFPGRPSVSGLNVLG